jgi:perosamine synthetase
LNPNIPLSSPDITEAEIAAVTAVLRTPHLSMGPELAAFESALAEYHSVPHAIAVSSGTAGLHMALLTLGIGEGDEVILPSFAFIAVAHTILSVQARPIFADIDPVTLNLTPSTVERVVTPRTRAILVVHTFGIPADMHALRDVAVRHQLAIIEDACEAIGAEFGNPSNTQRVGTFGDLSIFGFYPNKQITTGEGGAVLAHTQAHANRLRSLRNHGRNPDPSDSMAPPANRLGHPNIGFNYRLSDIACALGRVQLSRLKEILALRRAAAERYHSLLADIPCLEQPLLTLPQCTISWFVYVVRLPEGVSRTRIQELLAERGIATSTYFAPIHQQPAWREFVAPTPQFLPVTESIGPRALALPFFNRIAPSQQERVASSLREAISLQK